MSASEIASLLNNAEITLSEIRKAVFHLTKPDRADLYNAEATNHKSAAGKFFEALVYEILLTDGETSPAIEKIAAKLSDAKDIADDKFAPDGLWYSRDGEIRFKIKGRVAAEVDFLIKTADGVLVFGEVAASKTKGFAAEMAMKKELLEGLYHCKTEGIIVVPHTMHRRFDESDKITYAVVRGDESYQKVLASEVLKRNLSPTASTKRVDGRFIFDSKLIQDDDSLRCV